MMTRIFALLLLAPLLAACGADGEPNPPPEPGITVSGMVEIGVSGGS